MVRRSIVMPSSAARKTTQNTICVSPDRQHGADYREAVDETILGKIVSDEKHKREPPQ